MKIIKYLFLLKIITKLLYGQFYNISDPNSILQYEKKSFDNPKNYQSIIIRPILNIFEKNTWGFFIKNQLFFNDNSPNLENGGNRWVGKGFSYYSVFGISYNGQYLSFNIEPFYFYNQNNFIKIKFVYILIFKIPKIFLYL